MKAFTLISSIILLTACGESVRFEVAQPEGVGTQKDFPKRLYGEYVTGNDSSKLLITNGRIIQYTRAAFAEKQDSVDRVEPRDDSTSVEVNKNFSLNFKVRGDSVFYGWSSYDTLFDAAHGDLLKKYKGFYFLNRRMANHSWEVTTLTPIAGGVTLGAVSGAEDIRKLRNLTNTPSDSIFLFRPTKEQLQKFLRENGFSEQTTYLRKPR